MKTNATNVTNVVMQMSKIKHELLENCVEEYLHESGKLKKFNKWKELKINQLISL